MVAFSHIKVILITGQNDLHVVTFNLSGVFWPVQYSLIHTQQVCTCVFSWCWSVARAADWERDDKGKREEKWFGKWPCEIKQVKHVGVWKLALLLNCVNHCTHWVIQHTHSLSPYDGHINKTVTGLSQERHGITNSPPHSPHADLGVVPRRQVST